MYTTQLGLGLGALLVRAQVDDLGMLASPATPMHTADNPPSPLTGLAALQVDDQGMLAWLFGRRLAPLALDYWGHPRGEGAAPGGLDHWGVSTCKTLKTLKPDITAIKP